MLTRSRPSKIKMAARGARILSAATALPLLACSNACPKPENCVSLRCAAEIQDASVEWSFDQMTYASDMMMREESSRPAAGRCYISIPPLAVNADRSSKTPSRCDMPVKVVCVPGPEDQLLDAAAPSLRYGVSFRLPDPFHLSSSEAVRTLTVESNEWHDARLDGQTLTDISTPLDASGPTLVDADQTGSEEACWIRRSGAASMTIEESTGTSAADFRRILRIDLDTAGWRAETADAPCSGQASMRAIVRLVQTSANRVVEEVPCPWSHCE
jgi:hypothetical protein